MSLRVLVVDDEPGITELLGSYLAKEGYAVARLVREEMTNAGRGDLGLEAVEGVVLEDLAPGALGGVVALARPDEQDEFDKKPDVELDVTAEDDVVEADIVVEDDTPEQDRKAQPLYELFETGPMKRIAKYGGLPKPTGCV